MNDQKDKNGKEGRKFIRVEYDMPVTIETSDMTVPSTRGVLHDISAQGAMLEVNNKLNPGLFVKVHLSMEKNCDPLTGYVQWEKDAGAGYKVGIIFDEAHAEQNDRIVELVTEEIISEIKNKQQKLD